METWTEIRCPACVSLGWYSSHLLLRIIGKPSPAPVHIEIKCPRCKSLISWVYGTPEFGVMRTGRRNREKYDKIPTIE